VAKHQANHARIVGLTQTSEDLDKKILSTLQLLANTRKELLSTPVISLPKSRNVVYTELLDYAHNISKYTVPLTYRPPLSGEDSQLLAAQAIKTNGTGMNGTGVSPANGDAAASSARVDIGQGIGASALSAEQIAHLTHENIQAPFIPYPEDEKIRRGALGHIQMMMEQGTDPASLPSQKEAAAAAELDRLAKEEEEKRELEAKERIERSGQLHTSNPGAGAERKPAVFGGLDLYDPDEE
jgi:Vitamin-D-receptor interacting Mediator subunit 4